jgi:hypothetical protein
MARAIHRSSSTATAALYQQQRSVNQQPKQVIENLQLPFGAGSEHFLSFVRSLVRSSLAPQKLKSEL